MIKKTIFVVPLKTPQKVVILALAKPALQWTIVKLLSID